MTTSLRALAATLFVTVAGAAGLGVVGCHGSTPTSPAAGLDNPLDTPSPPDLGRGADRTRVHVLYNMHIDDGVRSVCSGPAPYFTFDSSKAKQSEPTMDALASCMKNGPLEGRSIRLIGHTDPRGAEGYNEKLGLERAEHVKGYLVNQGVDGARIKTVSAGEDEASGAPKDWSTDRRVQIQLDREVAK